MNILVLQETDWLTRGPHIQHHIFERLSKNSSIKITVIDYDIDNLQRSKSVFLKTREFSNIDRAIKYSKVKIVRTAHNTIVIGIPGTGDAVQAIKAGILEIADIYVVNKSDRPGADEIARELRLLLTLDPSTKDKTRWQVPKFSNSFSKFGMISVIVFPFSLKKTFIINIASQQ